LLAQGAPLFARRLPPDGKRLLARAPSVPLPDEILNRRKTGFGMPLRQWCDRQPASAGLAAARLDDPRLWSRHWLKQVARDSGLDGGRRRLP
jgi:asparagine synthase (glutamine-hydrolysing)